MNAGGGHGRPNAGAVASPGVAPVVWQPELWGFAEAPRVDERFSALVRHRLDPTSWADQMTGWVHSTDAVLDELLATRDPERVPIVAAVRSALGARYGVAFATTTMELLSGTDAIAWRQHESGRRFTNPVVATVSFGTRRTLRMRSRAGGGTTNFVCASGDLLVMGGGSQHTWDHSVPRKRRAHGPHVRLVFAPR